MFNVGDEIVCVDQAPTYCPVQKGDRFTCLAILPEGTVVAADGSKLGCECVSIGVDNPMLIEEEPGLSTYDLWPSCHFRKVERKRTREELYSLIGIDGMVDQRESVTAFHKFPCESTSLRAPARQPERDMAVGVTAGNPRGVSRGNDGARLAVTRADAGALSGVSSGRVTAAQRIGTAEGSGDGSSVRSDQREGVAA